MVAQGDRGLLHMYPCHPTLRRLSVSPFTRLEGFHSAEVGVDFAAPEVLTKGARYDGGLADVWSSGVALYFMLFKKNPFDPDDSATKQDVNDRILQGAIPAYMNNIVNTGSKLSGILGVQISFLCVLFIQ